MNKERALEYARDNEENTKEALKTLCRISSISAKDEYKDKVIESAEATASAMRAAGLENVELLTIEGVHPYVYGEWLHAEGAPTVILYAHHDVQPTGDLSKWETDPFEPTEKDGRLYGRGTGDDKAGIMVHLAAIASYLITEGKLPINIKCLFEGEEEIGSPNLETCLKKFKDKLKADIVVLTDTESLQNGVPGITTQLRGLVDVDIEVRALKKPVHSGGWGGPLPDPTLALAKMLAKLADDSGRIAIPGIYDDVKELDSEERVAIRKIEMDEASLRRYSGLIEGARFTGESGYSAHELIWHRPAISVNAIQASSRAEVSNVILDNAWAHVGIRIVPNMDPKKVQDMLVDFLRKCAPDNVEVSIERGSTVPWWRTETKHPVFRTVEKAMKAGYGKDLCYIGCGGSIGFVEPFTNVLGGVPAVLMGVEDPDTNAHSWNESLNLKDFQSAIRAMIHFFAELAIDKQ